MKKEYLLVLEYHILAGLGSGLGEVTYSNVRELKFLQNKNLYLVGITSLMNLQNNSYYKTLNQIVNIVSDMI